VVILLVQLIPAAISADFDKLIVKEEGQQKCSTVRSRKSKIKTYLEH